MSNFFDYHQTINDSWSDFINKVSNDLPSRVTDLNNVKSIYDDKVASISDVSLNTGDMFANFNNVYSAKFILPLDKETTDKMVNANYTLTKNMCQLLLGAFHIKDLADLINQALSLAAIPEELVDEILQKFSDVEEAIEGVIKQLNLSKYINYLKSLLPALNLHLLDPLYRGFIEGLKDCLTGETQPIINVLDGEDNPNPDNIDDYYSNIVSNSDITNIINDTDNFIKNGSIF